MAGTFDVKILGNADRRLAKCFKEMKGTVQKKLVRGAMRQAGKGMLDTARSLVPVDTGALKASLKLRALPRSRQRFGVRVIVGQGLEDGRATFTEWGTRNSPAIPFLRPAFDQNEERAKRAFQSGLREAVRAACKR